MKGYILAIAGVILLSVIVTVISPGGRTGKFVKGMMKLFTVLILISPIIGWIKGGIPDFSETSSTYYIDESYLRACADRLEEEDEAAISAYIREEYGAIVTVEVERDANSSFSHKKITIIVSCDGINGEDERINIVTCIREDFSKRYGCELEIS